MSEPEVLARVEGALGHLTLNRPRSMNALTPTMIADLRTALRDWAEDPAVTAVLIDGAGERGLCAGGDIKLLYAGIRGNTVVPLEFWTHEYEMNATVASFPKPFVAFMDGVVFGGGIGVSVHGSVRIVTERSSLAMPETAIGLAPDVGALYWYARMPGGLGTWAALTGARLNAGDAIAAGLADLCWPLDGHADLVDRMRTGWVPSVADGSAPPAASVGAADRRWIDDAFTRDSIGEIAAALTARPEPGAAAALSTLRTMSPTAVVVTLAAIRRAAELPAVVDVLAQDLRVSSEFTRHPDLPEGIRAALIDKDRTPRWSPDRWEDVTDHAVAAYFA
ncbi:MAG: 3-hydroxyisobutyryl-CoA hydrolase [Nakamurella sp.]